MVIYIYIYSGDSCPAPKLQHHWHGCRARPHGGSHPLRGGGLSAGGALRVRGSAGTQWTNHVERGGKSLKETDSAKTQRVTSQTYRFSMVVVGKIVHVLLVVV